MACISLIFLFWALRMQYLDQQLPYDNINELRKRMADVAPHLAKNDTVEAPMWLNGEYFKVRHVASSLPCAHVACRLLVASL